MFCMKCGNQNPDGSAFCARCGAPVWSAESAPAAQSQPGQTPEQTPLPTEAAPIAQADCPVQTAFMDQGEAPSGPSPFNAPEPAPQPVKEKRTKSKRAPKMPPPRTPAGIKLLSVFLIICFSLSFLLASTVGLVRTVIGEDAIHSIIEEIDIDESAVGKFIGIDEDELDSDDALAKYIYDNLSEDMQEIFSEKSVQNILKSSEARDMMAKIFSNYIGGFVGDEDAEEIDAEYIVALIDENMEAFTDGEEDGLSSKQKRNLKKNLEEIIDFEELNESPLSDEFDVWVSVARFMMSPLCYYLLIALCAVLFILIILAGRKNICACLRRLFITFTVLGAMYLIIALGGLALMIIDLAGLKPLYEAAAIFCVLRGSILFAVGLLGCIISKKVRNKERARAVTPA